MVEEPRVTTAQELEAMSAAERATTINKAISTDLDSLDESTKALVETGRDRVLKRLPNLRE